MRQKEIANTVEKIKLNIFSILPFLPVSYVAAYLSYTYQTSSLNSQLKVHLLAISSTLFTAALLFLFHTIAKRLNQIINYAVLITIILLLIVGVLRGVFIHEVGNQLYLVTDVSLMYRIYNSVITTLVWISLLSILVNKHLIYKQNYRLLFSQSVLNRAASLTDNDIEEQLVGLETSLKKIKTDKAQAGTESQLFQVAQEVKHQINSLIRPMSERLHIAAVNKYPKLKLTRTILDAFKYLNYSIIGLTLIYFITMFSNLNSLIPTEEAFARTSIASIAIIVIDLLFKRITFSTIVFGYFKSIVQLMALAFIPISLGDLLYPESSIQLTWSTNLALYLVLPILVMVFSVLALIERDRIDLLGLIADELDKSVSSNYQLTQLSSYLHNSLQSDLLAISKKLELAAISNNLDEQRLVLEQLNSLLNRSIGEEFKNFYESPRNRLTQVVANWQGLIDLNISNSDLIFIDPTKSIIAIQAIEEITSNAAKHSTTSQLDISCAIIKDHLVIKVIANDKFKEITKLDSDFSSLDKLVNSWSRKRNQDNQSVIEIFI